MVKRILTLDNLYQFYAQKSETISFSSKESGAPIVVTTEGFFEADENDMPGMLKLKLKVCHTQTNRNGSHISTENMEKAMPTLKYRPILAYIHELSDGTKDFYAHNVEVVEKEDGEMDLHYIESQVGCFTADKPWLEYDEDADKTYVMAYAVIPEEYTETADIIRRKNGTKVSCELVIDELSYNGKEKYLDITSFYFGGCTLLGVDEDGNEIGEGMLGARADIADFCHKEPVFTYQDKLIETLEKLNITLESLNDKKHSEKGGEKVMNKFEELLAKYGKTADEVTFEYENLSDEELEVAFKEAFEETEDESEAAVEEAVVVDESNEEPEADVEDNVVTEQTEEIVEIEEGFSLRYELSHDDIRCALYSLLDVYSDEGYCCAWIIEVYDNKFIYQNYTENKFYRQGYSVDGDTVSIDDNKVEVFNEWLSKDEKTALDALKENYSTLETQYNELKAFKDNYDAAELKAKKDAIFAREEYSVLDGNEAFESLKNNAANYSVEELDVKADVIFAKFIKENGAFTNSKSEDFKQNTVKFNFSAKENQKKKYYGNLFD